MRRASFMTEYGGMSQVSHFYPYGTLGQCGRYGTGWDTVHSIYPNPFIGITDMSLPILIGKNSGELSKVCNVLICPKCPMMSHPSPKSHPSSPYKDTKMGHCNDKNAKAKNHEIRIAEIQNDKRQAHLPEMRQA